MRQTGPGGWRGRGAWILAAEVARPQKLVLPLRDGVSASAVALPLGPWPTVAAFLAERLPKVSADDWLARMAAGEVLDLHGAALPPDAPYRAGGRLYYYRHLAQELPIPFEEQVLFVDEHLVVADKPHFLPVLPSGRYVQETLLVRLKKRLGLAELTPIHRIDRETAGLVVFCIQPQARNAYQALFRERAVHKVYEAIAPFRPELALPLNYRSRLQERPEAFMQMQEMPGEANAETLIELMEARGHLARYRLSPRTGQKHQLRAQMSALGLPILGDRIYPQLLPDSEALARDFSQPLQLLAKRLEFTDPLSGRPRCFESAQTLGFGPE
jgi:tRNA pseudouridine32 synthase/23S rRNA pseudouridine746 synthase